MTPRSLDDSSDRQDRMAPQSLGQQSTNRVLIWVQITALISQYHRDSIILPPLKSSSTICFFRIFENLIFFPQLPFFHDFLFGPENLSTTSSFFSTICFFGPNPPKKQIVEENVYSTTLSTILKGGAILCYLCGKTWCLRKVPGRASRYSRQGFDRNS